MQGARAAASGKRNWSRGGKRRVGGLLFALLASFAAWAQETAPLPYVVRQGDTLIGLGRTLLADPARWRDVARVNRLANPDRIATGSVLLIPVELLRSEPAEAQIVQAVGEVRDGTGQPLQAGAAVPEGAQIATGGNGYVTLRLADGTLLRIQSGTRAQIDAARRYPGLDAVDSAVRLHSGRVEVQVPPQSGGKPRFEVRTPQGVLGVRGTEFRAAADDKPVQTRGEVLRGIVDVAGRGQPRRVAGGFGTVVDSDGRVAEPVALLSAPEVSGLPKLQERILLRFALAKQLGAAGYRGQVARDRDFELVVSEELSTTGELRFGGLPDGEYFLRVRAIDGSGLEGRSADLAFRLKARPEAPLPSSPAPRTTLRATKVEFSWATNPQAATYRFQLASDAAFEKIVRERDGLQETRLVLDDLPPGDYFWRLRSVRDGDDRGPWGDALSFVLRPPPADPDPPAVGDKTVRLSWSGEPGQTFELQVARDSRFGNVVVERRLTEPSIELPRPGPGTYFVRYRAIDADGFVGPYSGVQRFELVNCVVDSYGACVRSGDGPLLSR